MIERALPEHEKAVVVRVPSGAPTFTAKLPQERWIAVLTLVASLYVAYQLSIVLLGVVAGAGAWWVCPLAGVPLAGLVALAVRRLAIRPEVTLDKDGLRVMTPGLFGRSRSFAIESIKGFNTQVVRRTLDNTESWHLRAELSDGRTVLLGKARKSEDASAVLRGLQDTLAMLKGQYGGYRVGL